jgi:hypothetical protein
MGIDFHHGMGSSRGDDRRGSEGRISELRTRLFQHAPAVVSSGSDEPEMPTGVQVAWLILLFRGAPVAGIYGAKYFRGPLVTSLATLWLSPSSLR